MQQEYKKNKLHFEIGQRLLEYNPNYTYILDQIDLFSLKIGNGIYEFLRIPKNGSPILKEILVKKGNIKSQWVVNFTEEVVSELTQKEPLSNLKLHFMMLMKKIMYMIILNFLTILIRIL